MVDLVELQSVPLLQTLTSEELDELAAQAAVLDVPTAGIDLARQGEFGHAVFAIVSGAAKVIVDGELVRELGPGDLFGEIAVMASGRRTATVRSASPMRLISLFKRDLWRLADRRPEFEESLRHVTSRAPH